MMPMTCRSLGIVTPRWPANIDSLNLQPGQPLSWTRQRCWSCTLHCDHHTTGQAGTRQPETLTQTPASTSGRAWHATTQESCHCECGGCGLVWCGGWLTCSDTPQRPLQPSYSACLPSWHPQTGAPRVIVRCGAGRCGGLRITHQRSTQNTSLQSLHWHHPSKHWQTASTQVVVRCHLSLVVGHQSAPSHILLCLCYTLRALHDNRLEGPLPPFGRYSTQLQWL